MKKIYLLLFSLVFANSFAQTIFSENMGTPSATTPIASNVFQNGSPIVFSGTADVRATTVSSGYTGASGSGNVFFTNTAGKDLLIEGINTSAYSAANLQLTFGHYKSTTAANNELTVEVSTDGTTYTPLTYSRATGTGTNNWTLISITTGIPSTTNLRIRFTQTSTTAQFRLDDVKVINFNPACTLVPGSPTTACDAVTFNLDTYTATIPYTGGGSGSYTIVPTAGTVGGDNPGTVAAGNILINGIPEGTTASVTITSGPCSYTVDISAPLDCKPANPLPFNESFTYNVGTVLGSTQYWSNSNSGDEITVATGNLSYTGVTPAGNSVTLAADGKECHAPFTATTSTEGTLYASFLMNVTDYSSPADASQDYFAVLTDGVSNNFKARVYIKKTGTQYQLGLTSGSSTTNYDATLFNVGDVVMVVLAYDFAGNQLKAWFNPNLATFNGTQTPNLTDTPATAITTLGGFLLRQGGATTNPAITVDELRVALTPPSSLSVAQNEIAGLRVSPNPVSTGMFYIVTELNATKNVQVYDIFGKKVVETAVTDNGVNVNGLSKGLYVVKITEEGKTAVKKLIIE